ncbi:hypothetical protein HX837_05360, partial [Marine Group I thaumarchaeote]|nr:hypothetical protein [Marine Group I thaumarchaeote]
MSANVEISDTFGQWREKNNEFTVMTTTDGSSDFIKLTNTTDSSSNITGSIITAGGVGIAKSVTIGENLTVHGDTTISGNLTFGDAATDQITFTADINSNIIPNADMSFDIGNTTFGWANTFTGHISVEQASDAGKPAITVTSADTDQIGISVTASQIDADVLDIAADAVTTAKVIDITADGLTTGSALYIDSDSSSTSTRSIASVIQNHASAVGATGLTVQADAGRGVFIDTNLAAGGYALEIDSEHTTTNVAKIASIATSGTLLELSAAGVLTGDVINITADSATTGKGINVSMDALTTGSMLYLDDASSSTSTRNSAQIIQNHDSAIAATALLVQSDSGVTGMLLDKNFPAAAVAAATVRGLWVDFDHTVPSSGTANFTDIGIDLDVNSAGLGTTTQIGLDVDVVGATSGTHTATGIDIAVSGGDTNYALITTGGNVGISTAAPASVLHVTGTVQVGVDDTGHDVTFYGAAAGSMMMWDEDADSLLVRGATADAAGSSGRLVLQTAQVSVEDGDILGRVDFQAPLET